MKHVMYRLMVDYEKEERWLNEMAAKGMNLIDYTLGRYVFEEGSPGEYIYRLELLKNYARNPESIAYFRFMDELGIECVATYMFWAYFRKKAVSGPFDIFTDNESRMSHCRRLITFSRIGFIVNLVCAIFNICIPVLERGQGLTTFNLVVGLLNLSVALALGKLFFVYLGRLRKLITDSQLRE